MSVSVVLSTPPTFQFVSWSIRKFTSSDVSHASIHFDGTGVLADARWVFEATSHGVVLTEHERWAEDNQVLYRFGIRDTALAYKGLHLALRELGAEYDYGGIGRFALYIICRKISPCLAERVIRTTPDQMFCSEAVYRYIQILDGIAGEDRFEKVRGWNPDLTSPEDLKRLRFCPEFEVIYANPGGI